MSDIGRAITLDGDDGPAAETDEAADALVGRVLDGRYRIVGRLGAGGMGLIYEAVHEVLGTRLALKVLRPEAATDEESLVRFEREAQAASAIGNEHIVDVRDFGRLEDGSTFVVMELIEGVDLFTELRSAPLGWQRASGIGLQICEALGAAHERGIVHRDLKAENVLLTSRRGEADFVKIVDFGIAKVTHGAKQITHAGRVMGTPEYMAPEQCAGRAVDARTDIYALGVLLYEMTTGQLPFYDPDLTTLVRMQMREPPVPPSRVHPEGELPLAFEAVVLRCLAKDPEARFSSMAELAEALERVLRGSGDVDVPGEDDGAALELAATHMAIETGDVAAVSARPTVVGSGRRAPRAAWAAAAVLAVVGLGAVAWVVGSDTTGEPSEPRSARPAADEPAADDPAPGEDTATREVVVPEEVAEPSEARAEPAPAETLIESEPTGAEVHRDGAILGVTPLRVERPEEGARFSLELRHAGHRAHEVTLSHLTSDHLRIVLERAPRRGPRPPAAAPPESPSPESPGPESSSPESSSPESSDPSGPPEAPSERPSGTPEHRPGFMDPWGD